MYNTHRKLHTQKTSSPTTTLWPWPWPPPSLSPDPETSPRLHLYLRYLHPQHRCTLYSLIRKWYVFLRSSKLPLICHRSMVKNGMVLLEEREEERRGSEKKKRREELRNENEGYNRHRHFFLRWKNNKIWVWTIRWERKGDWSWLFIFCDRWVIFGVRQGLGPISQVEEWEVSHAWAHYACFSCLFGSCGPLSPSTFHSFLRRFTLLSNVSSHMDGCPAELLWV